MSKISKIPALSDTDIDTRIEKNRSIPCYVAGWGYYTEAGEYKIIWAMAWDSNNVVCATSKVSDQPAHTRSLIKAFASRLNILWLLSYCPNSIWSF